MAGSGREPDNGNTVRSLGAGTLPPWRFLLAGLFGGLMTDDEDVDPDAVDNDG